MASNYNLATAYVTIVPTTKGAESTITSELGGIMDTASETAGSSFGSNFMKTAGKAIAGAAATITSAATSVWAVTTQVAEAGDEIDKTSQKLGVSAEQYQAMSYAAEHCGFEVSTFTTAAKNLESSGYDGTLYDALDAIMELDDETERMAMAEELFGTKAAMSMAAYLNGEETMSDYKDTLEDIGGLMSNESVAASAAFEDSLTDLKTSFQGLESQTLSQFLPAMTQVMGGLTAMFSGDESGVEKAKEGIRSFIDGVTEMLPEIIELGVQLLTELIIGIIESIPTLVSKAPQIISAFVNGISACVPSLVDMGQRLVQGLWNGISNAKQWIINKISGWVSSVVSSMKSFFGIHSPSKVMRDQIGAFLPLGLAEGIEDNAYAVDDAMNDLMTSATGTATANLNANVTGNMANSDSSLYNLLATYLPMINQNCGVTLEADAKSIFNVVRNENNKFTKATGYNAMVGE